VTKRDLLALEDWSPSETEALLKLAQRIKRGELTGGLEKRVLGVAFLNSDPHTRRELETAMFLHGGKAVAVEQGGPGSDLIDIARVLGRSTDALAVRAFQTRGDWAVARHDPELKVLAENYPGPVLNLGSARRHPCQALADAMTLQQHLGRVEGKRFVLTWAWNSQARPTGLPASAALAAARLGMEIVIARPEGFELDPEDTALIRKTAQQAGGEFVHISDDPDDALVGADAVYVASWGSVKLFGQPEQERAAREGLRDWRLTGSRLRSTRGGKGVVLHAFPFGRNVEIEEKVLENAGAAMIDQAENRLHAARAVLLQLVGSASER
jgi:N-acetylornithine carbamoyltransferase